MKQPAVKVDRENLEKLYLEVQRDRIALTRTILKLKGASVRRRPRIVMGIIVALLRLQRGNRQALATLGLPPT